MRTPETVRLLCWKPRFYLRHPLGLVRSLRRTLPDALAQDTARMLPRRVAYFASIRVMAHATTGAFAGQIVPELTAMDALQRWDSRDGATRR